MLSSILSSTPVEVEELQLWSWIVIGILFASYCLVLKFATYFFVKYDKYRDYDKWRHISYAIIAIIFLLIPAWLLFRGYPGQWGGLWLFIPAIFGLILSCYLPNRYGNTIISVKEVPWSSLLGITLVAIICGGLDYISEKLASIPMSWGAFIFIIIGFFAWGASRD